MTTSHHHGRALAFFTWERIVALREEITHFEAENVGKKDWVPMGEVNSCSCPQKFLLEEDLELNNSRRRKGDRKVSEFDFYTRLGISLPMAARGPYVPHQFLLSIERSLLNSI